MFTYGRQSYLDQLIPTLVGGTLENSNTVQAYFDPPHAAWKYLGPGHMSVSVGEGLQASSPLIHLRKYEVSDR